MKNELTRLFVHAIVAGLGLSMKMVCILSHLILVLPKKMVSECSIFIVRGKAKR